MAVLARTSFRMLALPLVAGAILLAPGMTPGAHASACHRYGHESPGSISAKHAEAAVMCYVNRKRTDRGMPRLDRHSRVVDAANRHSGYMLDHGCFSHQCSGEGSLDSRLRSVGYLVGGMLRWSYGENIAWGEQWKGTPAAIVNAWMHSAGHRANILNRSFRDAGVGVAWGTPYNKRANGGTYTIDFGYRLLG